MEHKVLKKTQKSLNYQKKKKKHSKRSKRKSVIHEYEIHISNLFKRLKIDDKTDSENSDSEKYVLPDVLDLEPLIPDKLLKCNLKTYSSYTTSKSLNIYNQSKSKCIRFISIDKYLQGKVSCTTNCNPYFKSRPQQIYEGNEIRFDTDRSLMVPKFTKVFEIPKVYNTHSNKDKCNSNSGFLQEPDIKSLNQYEGSNLPHFSGNYEGGFKKQNFELSKDMQMKHIESNMIGNFNNLFFQTCISPYKDVLNKKMLCTFKQVFKSAFDTSKNQCMLPSSGEDSICNVNKATEVPSECSETLNSNPALKSLNASSKISQTILDLFWLELKIKRCRSILKKFNYKSKYYKEFASIKRKGSRLIMKHMRLVNKESTSEFLIDRSSNDQSRSISSNACSVNSENEFSDPAKESYLTEMKKSKTGKRMKRNCKRKRQEKDSGNQVLKRSKKLDECIMRASTSRKFAANKYVPTANASTPAHNEVQKCQDIVKHDMELASTSGFEATSKFATSMTVASTHGSVSEDLADKEIETILAQLSPLQGLSTVPETFCSESIDLGSPSDTIHCDVGDGKRMVILPYIDLDF